MTPTKTEPSKLIDHSGAIGRAARRAPWSHVPNVEGIRDVDELLTRAGLDWPIRLEPMVVTGESAAAGLVPKTRAVVRMGEEPRVLSTAGVRYEPIQNRWIAEMLLDGLAEDYPEVGWQHAGPIKGGREVIFVAKLNGMSFRVDANDEEGVDPYLIVLSSHGGHRALQAFITSMTIWCTNQLRTIAPSAIATLRVQHSGQVNKKVIGLATAIERETVRWQRFQEWAKELATLPANAEAIDRVGYVMHGEERTRARAEERRVERIDALRTNFANERGRSLWHLLNASTEWTNHEATYRPREFAVEDVRATSLLQGTVAHKQWDVVKVIDRIGLEQGLHASLSAGGVA